MAKKKSKKKTAEKESLGFETEDGKFIFVAPSFTHKGQVYHADQVIAGAEKEGEKGGPNQELLATLVKIRSGVIQKGE